MVGFDNPPMWDKTSSVLVTKLVSEVGCMYKARIFNNILRMRQHHFIDSIQYILQIGLNLLTHQIFVLSNEKSLSTTSIIHSSVVWSRTQFRRHFKTPPSTGKRRRWQQQEAEFEQIEGLLWMAEQPHSSLSTRKRKATDFFWDLLIDNESEED